MVKYLEVEKTLMGDLEGDVNVESDCEDDSSGTGDVKSEKEREGEESRTVLVVGSFSAYVSFLPGLALREVTSSPGGNPFSSIAART